MDNAAEQLHPNWRALSTIHIPLKRFIKEGTQAAEKGQQTTSKKKYVLALESGGTEISEFYEQMVNKEGPSRTIEKKQSIKKRTEKCVVKKQPFDVNKYHRLSMQGNVEMLKELDFQRNDINVCDSYGWSALMMAACEGSFEVVKFLIELGVNRDIQDRTGKTAKDLAGKKGHFHIEQLLEASAEQETAQEYSSDEEYEELVPFYCDICKRTFTETSERQHQTSTLHQFNDKPSTINKVQKFNIPPRNRGLQLMVKQGWDKESGLGPSQSGRLYPVKTVIRKQRSGLGIDQQPARVTHFQAFDKAAVQRHNSDFYKKKSRNSNDIQREKVREWKRDRRLRNELK